MNMKVIDTKKKLCVCCMEKHEVKTVLIKEHSTFKNVSVDYEAVYEFCDLAEVLFMNEQQIRENDIRLKNAYRKLMSA